MLNLLYSFSPVKGGVDAKELFHLYIMVWIQDKRLSLLESCKLDKVHMLLLEFLSLFLMHTYYISNRKPLNKRFYFTFWLVNVKLMNGLGIPKIF